MTIFHVDDVMINIRVYYIRVYSYEDMSCIHYTRDDDDDDDNEGNVVNAVIVFLSVPLLAFTVHSDAQTLYQDKLQQYIFLG